MKLRYKMISGFLLVFSMVALVVTVNCQNVLPEPPILISPQDGAEFSTTPPEFIWHSDPEADSYLLRITQDSITSPIVILNYNTTDTTYELSQGAFDQLPSEKYVWAVASLSAEDDSMWSDPLTFSIKHTSTITMLISPDDGQIFNSVPLEFIWHKYESEEDYLLRVVKDNFITGLFIIDDTITDTSYTIPDSVFTSAPNGNFIWSVAPLIHNDRIGWGEFRSFVVDKTLPNGPDLISPREDETISETPPTFTWHAEPLAEYYRIKVYGEDSPIPDTIILDTVSDTTYSLPEDDFKVCFNGRYSWKVSAIASGGEEIWCDPQGFYIDKPVTSLDLDTTYFPFGLNYTWVYERWHYYPDWRPFDCDTFIISVVNSTETTNEWIFELDGKLVDVGDLASIRDNIVTVFGKHKVYIMPNQINTPNFNVNYIGDTLNFSTYNRYDDDSYWWTEIQTNVKREKGLGTIYQEYSNCDLNEFGEYSYFDIYSDSLLYFIKGTDTVWRCEDCP